jgi:hypothetical protein
MSKIWWSGLLSVSVAWVCVTLRIAHCGNFEQTAGWNVVIVSHMRLFLAFLSYDSIFWLLDLFRCSRVQKTGAYVTGVMYPYLCSFLVLSMHVFEARESKMSVEMNSE